MFYVPDIIHSRFLGVAKYDTYICILGGLSSACSMVGSAHPSLWWAQLSMLYGWLSSACYMVGSAQPALWWAQLSLLYGGLS